MKKLQSMLWNLSDYVLNYLKLSMANINW
jgi:hypothetical protein